MNSIYKFSLKHLFSFTFGLIILVVSSCEGENELDSTDSLGLSPLKDSIYTSQSFKVYNIEDDSVKTNSLPYNSVGTFLNDDLGTLKSSYAYEFSLPRVGLNFGTNPILDSVVYYTPLLSRFNSSNDSDDVNLFINDSIYGNSQPIDLKLFSLSSRLQPNDSVFYHFETLKTANLLGEYEYNYQTDSIIYVPLYESDTLKLEPGIKLQLDKNYFEQTILNNSGTQVLREASRFKNTFPGIFVTTDSEDGSIISTDLSQSFIELYYHNDSDTTKVILRTNTSFDSRVQLYEKDNTTASSEFITKIETPNIEEGEETIYLQGMSSSRAIIQLFDEEELVNLRSKNWLINEAKLTIPVGSNPIYSIPRFLSLLNANDNSVLKDIDDRETEFGGVLDDDRKNYVFKITRHVVDVLQNNSENIPLALDVSRFNFSPFRVIVNGNKSIENPMKLEIFFTEIP